MAIATASVGIAAGSEDPLIEGCRLRWPNSASNGRVNLPILFMVDVATTFTLLATRRGGGMIGIHLAWVLSNLCSTGSSQGSTVGREFVMGLRKTLHLSSCCGF